MCHKTRALLISALAGRRWQVLLELRGIPDHPAPTRVRHLDRAQGRAGTQQGSGTGFEGFKIVFLSFIRLNTVQQIEFLNYLREYYLLS